LLYIDNSPLAHNLNHLIFTHNTQESAALARVSNPLALGLPNFL
jgi:hypothetical protein